MAGGGSRQKVSISDELMALRHEAVYCARSITSISPLVVSDNEKSLLKARATCHQVMPIHVSTELKHESDSFHTKVHTNTQTAAEDDSPFPIGSVVLTGDRQGDRQGAYG